jgi:hypothetical protein
MLLTTDNTDDATTRRRDGDSFLVPIAIKRSSILGREKNEVKQREGLFYRRTLGSA